jgi:hypothetical protein
MTTPLGPTDLPLEVLAEIALLLLRHRRDPTPLILSDTIDDVMRAQPGLRLSRDTIGDAIVEGANAARLNIYSSGSPRVALVGELDRLDDDGAPAH